MSSGKKQCYESIGCFSLEEVLPFISVSETRVKKEYAGVLVNVFSNRLRTFAIKGITCVTCGVAGKYFSLERIKHSKPSKENSYHFNLYAIKKDGTAVLMTADHILAHCLGGKDDLRNLQPMCYECNNRKSIEEKKIFEAKGVTK